MIIRGFVALASIAILGSSAVAQVKTGMINVGDATLRYELSGRGQTVVFVHGWANTLAIWDDQVPAFNTRYQVLRYDRRGFGRATGDADVSADPDDLRILLDSLGIASVYVVGLSAGSEVATRFAFAYPRRTLALVRLSGPPPQGMRGARPAENREVLAEIVRNYGIDSLHKFILSRPGFLPPADETDAERTRRVARQQQPWDYSGRDLLDCANASDQRSQRQSQSVGDGRFSRTVSAERQNGGHSARRTCGEHYDTGTVQCCGVGVFQERGETLTAGKLRDHDRPRLQNNAPFDITAPRSPTLLEASAASRWVKEGPRSPRPVVYTR
jgi:pimeloyl-ACP methyl ester carboxylesterase